MAAKVKELARERALLETITRKPVMADVGTSTRGDGMKKALYGGAAHSRAPGAKRPRGKKSQHASASEGEFPNGEARRMAAKLATAADQLLDKVAETADLAKGAASDPEWVGTGQMLSLQRGATAALSAVRAALDDQATLERREKKRVHSQEGKADRDKRFKQKHLPTQKAKGPEGGKKRKKRLASKHAADKRNAGGRGRGGRGWGGGGRGSSARPRRSRRPAGRSYSRSPTPRRRAEGQPGLPVP